MRAAIAKRTQPGIVMPGFFLRTHVVSGHAEMPDKSANQPLVNGSGPRVMRSPKPPPPAMIVHAQATNKPRVRASFWLHPGWVVCSIC